MFKKVILSLFGLFYNVNGCLSGPEYTLTRHNIITIPVQWMKDVSVLPPDKILDFSLTPLDTSIYKWIVHNKWGIEEWRKDNLFHFKKYFDRELNCTTLRIDIHTKDGDGSSQLNYNQGGKRVRQEIKVSYNSDEEWKMYFGDKVHMNLGIKFNKYFKYSGTHFYHVFQLKPFNDDSHMPVFTVSAIRNYFYLSFNTILPGKGIYPVFTLFKIAPLAAIVDKWLNIDIFFNPLEHGESEIYFIVRDLHDVILHVNYLKGTLYVNKNSFIRPKIGQYHSYVDNIQKTNIVYYSHISIKKFKPIQTKPCV